METNRIIQIIHAKDADQHLGNLRDILEELKNENRINSYTTVGSVAVEVNSFQNVSAGDMVILLLTYGLEKDKSKVEEILLQLKVKKPDCNIAEIIVDNIPYEPQFITFPADLQPIRSREDMDTVWQRIQKDLKDLFPTREVKTKSILKKNKILKYLIIGLILTGSVYILTLADNEPSGVIEVNNVQVDRIENNRRAIMNGRVTTINGRVKTGIIRKHKHFYVNGSETDSFNAHLDDPEFRVGNEIKLRVYNQNWSNKLNEGDELLQYKNYWWQKLMVIF